LGRYLLAASLVLGVGFLMGFHAAGGPLVVLAAVALVRVLALSWV
jgi:hypothetical protein